MIIVKNFGSQNLEDYQYQIDHDGKFVIYDYCISVIFFTFQQSSSVYLVKGHESGVFKGLGYTLVTILFGWWGIPFGPYYSIKSLINNLKGGRDVTYEVMESAKKELDPRNQYF